LGAIRWPHCFEPVGGVADDLNEVSWFLSFSKRRSLQKFADKCIKGVQMVIELDAPVDVDNKSELEKVLAIRRLGCLALDVSIRAFEIKHASLQELADLTEKVARMARLLDELAEHN
jgi:hypothetical protein